MRLIQNEEYQKHYPNNKKNPNTKGNQSHREIWNIGIESPALSCEISDRKPSFIRIRVWEKNLSLTLGPLWYRRGMCDAAAASWIDTNSILT